MIASKIFPFALACAVGLASCGKEDKTNPVLTLKGEANQTVSLNSIFTDPGATALDEKDGDLTSKISVSGTVNINKVDDYILEYSVSDEAGNKAIEKRIVSVRNDADRIKGFYSVKINCSASSTSTITDEIQTSTYENNRVNLKLSTYNWNGYQDLDVYGKLENSTIFVPSQTVGGYTLSGTGTIVSDKKITFNYSYYGSFGSNSCSAEFTK
jgi:hypothetical protein